MNTPATTTTRRTTRNTKRPSGAGWPVAAALVVLTLIPLSAGILRLLQLAGGLSVMPADDRFVGFPAALVIHIAGSACFALLGVGQLITRFRRRHLTWHRRAGRVLVVAGLAVVGSALWLTIGYPAHPGTGPILFVARLLAATAMGTFLVLGFAAIRRRDITAHRAWMVRAYALALGAGTQAFTEGLTEAAIGPGVISGDLAKLGGWVINLAVAEWAVQRTSRARGPRSDTHSHSGGRSQAGPR
ncbi:DUF2306 domain-containing protein [Nocardioides eburneiflavus]|uniref:DUF2306 domain-containing protein n=1 Tax=Nocardioides eburneiflavus TaxID=2518372 RepID=A0A4Z1CH51_9ACTN|nr:DUF2306 domain-containing protein [Nocardioides eburneiflavus]TGN65368.1 DUF2306 domain-containing protein [Nocardioides eburneiflavus]